MKKFEFIMQKFLIIIDFLYFYKLCIFLIDFSSYFSNFYLIFSSYLGKFYRNLHSKITKLIVFEKLRQYYRKKSDV